MNTCPVIRITDRWVIRLSTIGYQLSRTGEPREKSSMRYPKAGEEDLRAPRSQYRVIGVDTEEGSGTTYLAGDFADLEAAHAAASARAGIGKPVYIYNDAGKVLVRLGSWH